MIYFRRLKGYKYELAKEYRHVLPFLTAPVEAGLLSIRVDDGIATLIIRKGHAWDGPSGPAIDTKNFMRGSLIHDALYQLVRGGYLGTERRHAADDLLRAICIEDGMSRARAWWVWRAVRSFAARAVHPVGIEPQDIIETAP